MYFLYIFALRLNLDPFGEFVEVPSCSFCKQKAPSETGPSGNIEQIYATATTLTVLRFVGPFSVNSTLPSTLANRV